MSRRWSPLGAVLTALLWSASAAGAPTPYATPVDIAPPATTARVQSAPDVGMAQDGHAFVVYVEDDGDGTQGLWLQRVSAGVVKEGARIPVGPAVARNDFPAIAMAPDGRFVVAYRSFTTTSTGHIEVQRFSADGSPIGAAIPVDGANNDN